MISAISTSVNAGISNAPDGASVAVRAATYTEPYVYTGRVEVVTWSGRTVVE